MLFSPPSLLPSFLLPVPFFLPLHRSLSVCLSVPICLSLSACSSFSIVLSIHFHPLIRSCLFVLHSFVLFLRSFSPSLLRSLPSSTLLHLLLPSLSSCTLFFIHFYPSIRSFRSLVSSTGFSLSSSPSLFSFVRSLPQSFVLLFIHSLHFLATLLHSSSFYFYLLPFTLFSPTLSLYVLLSFTLLPHPVFALFSYIPLLFFSLLSFTSLDPSFSHSVSFLATLLHSSSSPSLFFPPYIP